MSLRIIAEVAQGYEGDPGLARVIARACAATLADAVKYQCVIVDEVCVPAYQHYAFFKKIEMPESLWAELAETIRASGKEFHLNVGGMTSLAIARNVGAACVKIHATNFFNAELIERALADVPQVNFSLGGIAAHEVQALIDRFGLRPGGKVSFTYGFQSSPTPMEKNNLRKLGEFKRLFPGFSLGFEDHEDGGSPDAGILPLLALPFGVSHLEKHITLDPLLGLEDSESAIAPAAFNEFVSRARRLESALGTESLDLTEVERAYRKKVLKICVAARDLPAGAVLEAADVALKRTPDPDETCFNAKEATLGKKLRRPLAQHAKITSGDLA